MVEPVRIGREREPLRWSHKLGVALVPSVPSIAVMLGAPAVMLGASVGFSSGFIAGWAASAPSCEPSPRRPRTAPEAGSPAA